MSLVARVLGVGLCLLGGWMIGYVQGLQSIVDAASNIAFQVSPTLPNTLPSEAMVIANSFAAYVQGDFNPARASYWEFGVIVAFLGFILIARGERKPPSFEEGEQPLLLQPLSETKKE